MPHGHFPRVDCDLLPAEQWADVEIGVPQAWGYPNSWMDHILKTCENG